MSNQTNQLLDDMFEQMTKLVAIINGQQAAVEFNPTKFANVVFRYKVHKDNRNAN